MKSSIAPPIGIDFGTTNSSMAWFNPEAGREGRAEIIRGDNGGETTPSLVYFGEGGIEVGVAVENRIEDAKIYAESERQAELLRIVKSVKRDLGSRALITFSEDQEARPVEVAAAILDKLRQDVENNLFRQEVKRAVVTCPAVFTAQQRKKLREAARLARLEEIELLEEPVAAAMAFVNEGYQVGNGVLVYDLGGGTFDLAFVVREADGSFRVAIEPEGDARCGGDDFDQALYDYFDRLAREKLGRSLSPAEGKVDLFYLLDCRKRKENLSFNESAFFKHYLANGPSGPIHFDARIERATFEGLIIEDVEKTVRKTAEMARRIKREGYTLDTVVLIGGSSQIPLIRKRLEQALTVAPQKWMHHHLAVALGAACHAKRLWPSPPPPSHLRDSNLDRYRAAVQSAWANKRLEEKALHDLFNLAVQLGLNPEKTAEIEVKVMGASKEQIWDRQKDSPPHPPPYPDSQLDRYRIAVQNAWMNKRLEKKTLHDLFKLARQLGISREQAAEIEVKVMGMPKEQIWGPQKSFIDTASYIVISRIIRNVIAVILTQLSLSSLYGLDRYGYLVSNYWTICKFMIDHPIIFACLAFCIWNFLIWVICAGIEAVIRNKQKP